MNRSAALFFLLVPALSYAADDVSTQAATVLKQNCAGCHGAAMKASGLDVRSREALLTGGERGAAIKPGKPEESRLYRQVAGLDTPSMPPGRKLKPEQIDVLRQWIEAGAELKAPAVEEKVDLSKLEERPITAEERQYWAFVPPKRAEIPANGAKNPVDAFVNQVLAERHLKPAPRADRRSLLRRAYLDLIGLPPSPEQTQAFLNDLSPDAFAKVVEELLANPHYGERWGRHWLDLVRYADSGGFEYDRDRGNAWRYRDYVIKAFQDDKPYSQFLKEQLAGDEFAPDSYEARIATGYLRQGLENNIKTEQTRLDELDDLVSTTSTAFLGLTVGCARCHNHKFDPIPQKDYYRLQAVFFPTRGIEFPLVSKDVVAQHKAENDRLTKLQEPLKQQLEAIQRPYRDAIAKEKIAQLPEYIRVALDTPADKRTE